ncbi:MAG: 50S ribosomal protein L11 methyltransferase [Verrucomicrobiota bacterium]
MDSTPLPVLHVWSKLSAARWEDAWMERFYALPKASPVITSLPGGKTVRVEVYCERKADAEKIRKEFGGTVRELKPQNWAAPAAARLEPVKVRDRLIITHDEATQKAQQEAHPDRIVLLVPGEMAFGTGDHATTSTCLRVLADEAARRDGPWSVLDLGCGTGILALAAARLGAKPVAGFDYDPAAVRISRKNAALNGVKGVKFTRDDMLTWQPETQYDIVLANIFYDVLTLSFEKIAAAAKPGGMVIVSGILHEQAEGCLAAGTKAGLKFQPPLRRGKWVTAVARKDPS